VTGVKTHLSIAYQESWYAPIAPVLLMSRRLWESWGVSSDFTVIVDFVSHNLREETAPWSYTPSFYSERLDLRHKTSSVGERRRGEVLKIAIAHLEMSIAHCVACRRPSPKPVANYLCEARALVALAESTAVEARTNYLAGRRRGGERRTLPYLRVQRKILQLLQQYSPDGGWDDIFIATCAILPDVERFVVDEQIRLELHCLRVRVRTWIRGMPEAAALFRHDISPRPKRPSAVCSSIRGARSPDRGTEFLLEKVWMSGAPTREQS
jgi:hypothetical protein